MEIQTYWLFICLVLMLVFTTESILLVRFVPAEMDPAQIAIPAVTYFYQIKINFNLFPFIF